jgi:hypothetical protein
LLNEHDVWISLAKAMKAVQSKADTFFDSRGALALL